MQNNVVCLLLHAQFSSTPNGNQKWLHNSPLLTIEQFSFRWSEHSGRINSFPSIANSVIYKGRLIKNQQKASMDRKWQKKIYFFI